MATLANAHSAATWRRNNAIIAAGVLTQEVDTGKFKIGDGVLHYNSLPYIKIGHVQTLGPFSLVHTAFHSGNYLTAHTLFVPIVGMVIHDIFIDQTTAVAFSGADEHMMDIAQGPWAEGAVSLCGATGIDTTAPEDFEGIDVSVDGVSWPQGNLVVPTTDPFVAQFDPTGPPTTPPTAGRIDISLLVTFP